VERAPRTASRRVGGGLEEVPVDAVVAGDVVVVRGGEVVPVDGVVERGAAVVDESALTGEPLPVTVRRGGVVRSGTANSGAAFEVRALRPAAESAYAALVRLVRQAETQRAPFVRMADRYAAIFLPVTAAVAAGAWALSGSAERALAVFVVATPCPLILAAPIALMSGLSRCARVGVVVKGGAAIERLGEARAVLLDKTGTVTLGRPTIADVVALNGIPPSEALRLAASLDQLSAHPIAETLVREAGERELPLTLPSGASESFGHGIEGRVEGRRVVVGSDTFLRNRGYAPPPPRGGTTVLVGVDGVVAAAIAIDDGVRADAESLVLRLRSAGVRHVGLVTGDRADAAARVGAELGVDSVHAEQTPEEKLAVVRALRARPELAPVVMVGDGINDAPALALADVGIAMGAGGATASSQTADAIVLVDRVDRVADAIEIGRRSFSIARQSVLLGIGASVVAMGFAAAGLLPPVYGALLQEGIDVAVILNALRALR